MKLISLVFIALLVLSGESLAKDTKHYAVVAEFIRELGDTKNSKDIATLEFAETEKMESAEKNQQRMMGAIRNSTRAKLKLQANIRMLKSMNLGKPYETLIPALISWNEQKIRLYEEISKTAKAFVEALAGGPKPNVDYAKFAARMPEITANMEYAEESIFKLTPLVFMLLIDQKPDSENHLSHLAITKNEGQRLTSSIDNLFGPSLNEKNQNWTVSAASILREQLTEKGYKFSDDPWE